MLQQNVHVTTSEADGVTETFRKEASEAQFLPRTADSHVSVMILVLKETDEIISPYSFKPISYISNLQMLFSGCATN